MEYRDTTLFQHYHGFSFSETPDGLIDELGRPSHLFIVEDDDFSKLSLEINQSLSNVCVPSWANAVKEDLRQQIKELLESAPNSDGWSSVKYDIAPAPPTKDDPALLVKGNFVHCNVASAARKDVTCHAVYFCGVVYTTPSAKEICERNLLSVVYRTGLYLVEGVRDTPDRPSSADLDILLYEALGKKFKSTFGYAYDGANTTPTDKVGSSIFHCQVSFNSGTRNPAVATEATGAIISALNLSSAQDGDRAGLEKSIYDDLFLKIKHSLDADSVLTPTNSWYGVSLNREYPDNPCNRFVGKGSLYSCNGSIDVQETIVKRNFVYFIGVFYEAEVEGQW